MADVERRRRRHRHASEAGAPAAGPADAGVGAGTDGLPAEPDGPSAVTAAVQDPQPPEPTARRRGGGAAEDRDAERGLRGLVGSGSSQVGVGAALRARDAARPTGEQLAEAEAELVIVRRNWVPREDLPRHTR
ncbi:hypothetical protein ACFFWC_29055 [Plantactinospora siamensis]|uniref:Uncharacterized protein n=1 Tax=Plantactinospora siamensis TaxID=555372 RepID=A0ABV6NY36_9ACTN